jgi:hypothetical protein
MNARTVVAGGTILVIGVAIGRAWNLAEAARATPPDSVIAKPAAAASSMTPVSSPPAHLGWVVRESQSLMSDSAEVRVALLADTVTAGLEDMTLIVRCQRAQLEAYVIVSGHTLDSYDDRSRVRVRWDEDPPVSGSWGISSSGTGVFAPNPGAFVRDGLLKHARLRLELNPYSSGPAVGDFYLAGLDAHTSALKAACPRATL